MQHDVQLGKTLNGTEHRDAVHIAVVPVRVRGQMLPGEHVGLVDGEDFPTVTTFTKDPLGIIDPLLGRPLKDGEYCYLWLYPQTVTGMRHHWEHPSFPDKPAGTAFQVSSEAKAAAEGWLRAFANRYDLNFIDMVAGAKDFNKDGRYMMVGDNQDACDAMYEGENSTLFWRYFEVYTGETVKEDTGGNFFRCAC